MKQINTADEIYGESLGKTWGTKMNLSEIKSLLRSIRWRQLMEEYDERIGIMTEGRQITDEDVLAAWESVLDKKQYNGGW